MSRCSISSLAIFGGTFDPIHNAHLTIARAALESLGLARVLFIPAFSPPHRSGGALAPYEDRFRMVQIACEPSPEFEASRLEEGADPSYSVHTIDRVRAAYPSFRLYFLIGADAFSEIGSWHRSQDVIAAVSFIVVSRPGAQYRIPPQARVERLENFDLTVSSSGIRESIKSGLSDWPVPASVAAYIQDHGLYR